MRFFKYLVFIVLSFISVDVLADYSYTAKNISGSVEITYVGSESSHNENLTQVCKQLASALSLSTSNVSWTNNGSVGQCTRNSSVIGNWTRTTVVTKCPPADYPSYYFMNAGDPVPKQLCSQNSDGTFCKRTTKGNPMILNHENNRQSVLMFNSSETPVQSCNNLFDNQCDKTDPYGACFQPPDDGCTRQADGSIVCPDDTPPPQPDNTCNGATYCKRPPEGCGEGYVSGSFNGELLCVKSGPSNPQEPKPDDPNDPDNCKNGGSYCEAPPNDQACPAGYYESTYNGSKICVKNSPDPNQPNPNDPNNNDPNNPPDPNNPNNPNPGEGFDDSGIINAIKALRDALLGAIGGVSGKLTTLINGQKQTNEHLDDIKKESIKSNEKLDRVNENITSTNLKLDKSNEYLKDISDHSRAASDAIGESNKKLDRITDAIDGLSKCENESYNENDQNSKKYRECTDDDFKKFGDSNKEIPMSEIGQQTFSLDLFRVSAAYCPADKHLHLQTMFGTFSRTYSLQEMCNQTAFFGYFVLILAYSYAVSIVLRA